jgi:Domain of unknown function (DUF4062)
MSPTAFRVFLSAVSSEFGALRSAVASDLRARGVEVKVQEDFRQEADADTTLRKLHNYIRDCSAVVCLAGKRSGEMPPPPAVAPFAGVLPPDWPEASYTQWEFFFARHHGKRLSIYIARDYEPEQAQPTGRDFPPLQERFVTYLKAQGLDRGYFGTRDELRVHVLREDWPQQRPHRVIHLPYGSIGTLFKGRDEFLERLHEQLQRNGVGAIVARQAIHGLGGVGKTRLAIEYAWRHQNDYSAVLFLSADSVATLRQHLAALCGPLVLNLPEHDAREEDARIAAALRWLAANPGWFLIIDNVDTQEAAEEVERLLTRLHAGHVCITSRIGEWSGAVQPLELDVLAEEPAAAFLLERTAERRRATATDAADARTLAARLGHLALALEQAGAFVAKFRCSLGDYLRRWEKREKQVRTWHDQKLMKYPRSVAVTWDTSFAKLAADSQTLLNLLCWYGPEPIPRAVLETEETRQALAEGVARLQPGAAVETELETALAGLAELSLAKWLEGGERVQVHRLVAEVTNAWRNLRGGSGCGRR